MSNLYIRQIEVGPMGNFVYLLGDSQSRLCAVVDPAWQIDTITHAAEEDGYKITLALLTHHHFDHTNGLTELLEKYNIPVYAQKKRRP